jgi:hypothetical protein
MFLEGAQNQKHNVILTEWRSLRHDRRIPSEFEPNGSNSLETLRGVYPEPVEGLRVT